MKSKILFLAVVSTIGAAAQAQDVQFINSRGPSGWEGETICSGQNTAQWQPGPNGTLVAVNPQATLHCKVYLANNSPELRAHEMEHVDNARRAQAERLRAASGNMGPAATANQTFNQRTAAVDARTAAADVHLDRVTDHGRRSTASATPSQNYQQHRPDHRHDHHQAIPRAQVYYGGSYAAQVVYESSTTLASGPGYTATYQQQVPIQQYHDGGCTIEKYQVTGRCF